MSTNYTIVYKARKLSKITPFFNCAAKILHFPLKVKEKPT